jgi:tRNA threonylcarbamoyladenosine biosynthesis protein TsaE
MEKIILTHSKDETIKLGLAISSFLRRGDVILLSGDLGAGKTTLTQGIAQGLGIKEKVISPTFNILKCYFNQRLNMYHIDAYRLENNKTDIGLNEFIDGDGVCVVEWPQYIQDILPKEGTLNICIKNKGENNREFVFACSNDHFNDFFTSMNGGVL